MKLIAGRHRNRDQEGITLGIMGVFTLRALLVSGHNSWLNLRQSVCTSVGFFSKYLIPTDLQDRMLRWTLVDIGIAVCIIWCMFGISTNALRNWKLHVLSQPRILHKFWFSDFFLPFTKDSCSYKIWRKKLAGVSMSPKSWTFSY